MVGCGSSAGSGGGGDGGISGSSIGPTGNQSGSCTSLTKPARATAADVSHPTTVVGSGTATSCTETALRAAIATGGVITFDCGSDVVTIPLTATLSVPIDTDTVLDGGNTIALDGQNAVRILSFDSANWRANDHALTVQHIALINGKTTPTQAIPTAPAPCSQGWDDGQGGAIYMRDGNLNVIGALFQNDHAAPLGPDTGGGAIYVQGSKNGVVVASSTFTGNGAANAAAIGGLFAELDVYDSELSANQAEGNGANNADMTMCSVMNNGQYEIGSGGNGGAIYSDGASVNVTLCGDDITNNHAGDMAFGGGLFFTSNDYGGTLTIADTTMMANTGGHWTNVAMGSVTNAGTAVGTNAKSITITNSMLQGLP